MTTNAKLNFADWYRSAELHLTDEIQQKRFDAIETLMEIDDKAFWVDVVRIYLGIPVINPESSELFVKAFKDADAVFQISGNANHFKTLAGILLCFRLEVDSYMNTTISLAILNWSFLQQYSYDPNIPVLASAHEYLKVEILRERDEDLESHVDHIDDLITSIDVPTYALAATDFKITNNAVKALIAVNKNLLEETNILWWLFGETSVIFDDSFRNIGLPKFTLVAGREFFDLTTYTLGTLRHKAILSKSLFLSNSEKTINKQFSAYEVINKFTIAERKLILGDFAPQSEFTPVLTSLNNSLNFGTDTDWSQSTKAILKDGNIKLNVPAIDLTAQVFREFLYLKNLI